MRQFHLLMAGTRPARPDSLLVEQVCDHCLDHSRREHQPDTFEWHKRYLQDFCDRLGRSKATDLIPYHLTS